MTSLSPRHWPRLPTTWSPAAFAASADIAAIFVRHVDLALQSVVARDTLQQAVLARHRIGLAQGILMSRQRLTAAQSFSLLRQRSQDSNVKLRDVADQVIETGDLG